MKADFLFLCVVALFLPLSSYASEQHATSAVRQKDGVSPHQVMDEEVMIEKENQRSGKSGSCDALAEQNKSLRETIRAQNEYLLSFDNSSLVNNKIGDENAELKSKLYYLEQAAKSSAQEIKRLSLLNDQLQRELAKYKPQQARP